MLKLGNEFNQVDYPMFIHTLEKTDMGNYLK